MHFLLRERVAFEDKHKEFPVYAAAGRTKLNRVRLVRNGWHEVELCIQRSDAKKIWEMDFDNSEGLEAVIVDKSREDDEFEQVLWPLVPYRIREVDNQVVVASFRVASFPIGPFERSYWESHESAETFYANEGAVNAAPTGWYRTEYAYRADVRLSEFFNLDPETPQETLDAASVGMHYFARSDKLVSFYRSLAAITGTYWWIGLDDGKMHVELADADQEPYKPAEYLVDESERIEKKWVIPFLGPNRFMHRRAITESSFVSSPSRSVPLGLTLPTYYQPANQSVAQRYRPVTHYSTLVLPHLAINWIDSYSQTQVDEQAKTWERAVKATERTLNAWFRASSRCDWYRLGGYHPVLPGAEIASVTYQNGTTLVDYRDSMPPLWPRIPSVSLPTVTFVKLAITQRLTNPTRYIGTVLPPHSGQWSPAVAAQSFDAPGVPVLVGSIIAEDSLGLFPWLDVGDTCLAVYDGDRAVVVNTTLAADIAPS